MNSVDTVRAKATWLAGPSDDEVAGRAPKKEMLPCGTIDGGRSPAISKCSEDK